MQVSHVDKDMVEQSNTVPIFNLEGGLKPCLGLDLISAPGLVKSTKLTSMYLLKIFIKGRVKKKKKKKKWEFSHSLEGPLPPLKSGNIYFLFI